MYMYTHMHMLTRTITRTHALEAHAQAHAHTTVSKTTTVFSGIFFQYSYQVVQFANNGSKYTTRQRNIDIYHLYVTVYITTDHRMNSER